MSVRIEIYETLSQKLADLNYFEIIDIYKGQFSDEEANRISHFPCTFVTINSIDYEETMFDLIEGTALIDVHVFFRQFSDTEVGSNEQEEALEILTIMDTVVDELQGTSGNFFSELSQVSEEDLSYIYLKPAFKVTFSTIIRKRIDNNNYLLN